MNTNIDFRTTNLMKLAIIAVIALVLFISSGCSGTPSDAAEDICNGVSIDNRPLITACNDYALARNFYDERGRDFKGEERQEVRKNVYNHALHVIEVFTAQRDSSFASVRFGRLDR